VGGAVYTGDYAAYSHDPANPAPVFLPVRTLGHAVFGHFSGETGSIVVVELVVELLSSNRRQQVTRWRRRR